MFFRYRHPDPHRYLPKGEKPVPGISGGLLVEAVAATGFSNPVYIPSCKDIPSYLAELVRPGDADNHGSGGQTVGLEFVDLLKARWWYSAKAADQWSSAAEGADSIMGPRMS